MVKRSTSHAYIKLRARTRTGDLESQPELIRQEKNSSIDHSVLQKERSKEVQPWGRKYYSASSLSVLLSQWALCMGKGECNEW